MNDIIEILKDNGNRVDFVESLTVRMSPHTHPIKIMTVFMNRGMIYIICRGDVVKYAGTDNVINSIRQRLLLMKRVQHLIK